MPSGSRIRANNVTGTITNNPLTTGATSFNSANLALLPVVASNHAIVTLDPLRQFGAPEIVVVTAHSPSATVATITRGAYGTTAREHPEEAVWVHAPIDEDFTEILTSITRPSNPYDGQMIYETDTSRYKSFNGTIWVDLSTAGGGGFPVAMIVPTGAATAPSGWLMCEGAEVLASTYPALAVELGTGGSSRFGAATAGFIKLPDLRRAFPMGKAASGTGSTLASSGGSKDAVAVSHNHSQDAHDHPVTVNTLFDFSGTNNADTGSNGQHAHGIDGDFGNRVIVTGGNPDHFLVNVNEPNRSQVVSISDIDDDGSHAHNLNNHTHDVQHDHSAFADTVAASNQAAGASGTDANLPPWVAINYIIKAH